MNTNSIKVDTSRFRVYSNGHCAASKLRPDPISIKTTLAKVEKKIQHGNHVIIARYKWLKNRGLQIPDGMELPNLCLMIKNKKLIRAFYSNILSHIIKKQKYDIHVIN
jgi:hypothetical protein